MIGLVSLPHMTVFKIRGIDFLSMDDIMVHEGAHYIYSDWLTCWDTMIYMNTLIDFIDKYWLV